MCCVSVCGDLEGVLGAGMRTRVHGGLQPSIPGGPLLYVFEGLSLSLILEDLTSKLSSIPYSAY